MSMQKVVLNYRLYREFRHHILYPISSTNGYSHRLTPHSTSVIYFYLTIANLTPRLGKSFAVCREGSIFTS